MSKSKELRKSPIFDHTISARGDICPLGRRDSCRGRLLCLPKSRAATGGCPYIMQNRYGDCFRMETI